MFAIVALGALVALAGCGGSEDKPAAATSATQTPAPERVRVHVGDAVVQAEVADDPSERSRGLSGRAPLGRDEGMLFLLPDDQPTFWMKGMRFGLDIVWIRGRRVVDVTPRIPAPRTTRSRCAPAGRPATEWAWATWCACRTFPERALTRG